MSFGKAQRELLTDGLSQPLAEAAESPPLLLVPERDWAGRGPGMTASRLQELLPEPWNPFLAAKPIPSLPPWRPVQR